MLATSGDETAHHLPVERPALFRAEKVKLDDDGNAVREKASSGVELSPE